eukprot:10895577-Lingulodinium_polyedra.AAC.1
MCMMCVRAVLIHRREQCRCSRSSLSSFVHRVYLHGSILAIHAPWSLPATFAETAAGWPPVRLPSAGRQSLNRGRLLGQLCKSCSVALPA